MKSKFARVALVLVSGLIAGGAAFAQANPEQTPPSRMAGVDGDQKVGSHVMSGTLNPKVHVY